MLQSVFSEVRNATLRNKCNARYFIVSFTFFRAAILTHFRMSLFGVAHNDETWHSYTLLKEDPKNINHWAQHLSSYDISIFFTGN